MNISESVSQGDTVKLSIPPPLQEIDASLNCVKNIVQLNVKNYIEGMDDNEIAYSLMHRLPDIDVKKKTKRKLRPEIR